MGFKQLCKCAVTLLVLVKLAHSFDREGFCKTRCMQGSGGVLCQCNAFHFSGKRSQNGAGRYTSSLPAASEVASSALARSRFPSREREDDDVSSVGRTNEMRNMNDKNSNTRHPFLPPSYVKQGYHRPRTTESLLEDGVIFPHMVSPQSQAAFRSTNSPVVGGGMMHHPAQSRLTDDEVIRPYLYPNINPPRFNGQTPSQSDYNNINNINNVYYEDRESGLGLEGADERGGGEVGLGPGFLPRLLHDARLNRHRPGQKSYIGPNTDVIAAFKQRTPFGYLPYIIIDQQQQQEEKEEENTEEEEGLKGSQKSHLSGSSSRPGGARGGGFVTDHGDPGLDDGVESLQSGRGPLALFAAGEERQRQREHLRLSRHLKRVFSNAFHTSLHKARRAFSNFGRAVPERQLQL